MWWPTRGFDLRLFVCWTPEKHNARHPTSAQLTRASNAAFFHAAALIAHPLGASNKYATVSLLGCCVPA